MFIPELPPLNYKHQYAVLCDPTIERIEAFAAGHPKCFVFSFYTGAVDAVPDWSDVSGDHVMKPWYVGNLKPVANAIQQIVLLALEGCGDVDCVLDEAVA